MLSPFLATLLLLTAAEPAKTEPPKAAPAASPTTAHPAPSDKPKLLILQLNAAGIDPQVAGAVSESGTNEVAARGIYDVIGSREAQTMLGMERQRQVMGCGEESCMSELAGALGARFVLSGTLAKLGEAYQLTLQTLDSVKAQPVGRATKIASDLKALLSTLPYTVAEATGTPLPPPPSRVVPFTMMGVGAAAIVAGGLWGVRALGDETALARELQLGSGGPSNLQTRSQYQAQAGAIGVNKTISLAVMLAGGALIGAGVFLNPPDVVVHGETRVAVVPAFNGAAVVGVFQ